MKILIAAGIILFLALAWLGVLLVSVAKDIDKSSDDMCGGFNDDENH